MPTPTPSSEPVYFATPARLRAWFRKHAATAPELIVGFMKLDTGEPSVTWSESVDEALCVGWIDGVRHRIDDQRYRIRFTPRRTGSIWSAVNIAKVEQLTAEGRMQPAGLKAFEGRTAHKSRIYAYEQDGEGELDATEQKLLRKDKSAAGFYDALPPGYRKKLLHWITSAKQPETRAKRLGQLIDACVAGKRL